MLVGRKADIDSEETNSSLESRTYFGTDFISSFVLRTLCLVLPLQSQIASETKEE